MSDPSSADAGPAATPPLDWRAELAEGRFARAYRASTLAQEAPAEVRSALSGLADAEALVKDKAWGRAIKRLAALQTRPAILAWHDLEADLACLQRSGEALDRRRPDDALQALAEVRSELWSAEAETQRGTAMIYDGRLEDARAAFERALERDPDHYRALTNLGNVALEEGRVDDAIAAYERALRLNEDFANAHHNLAVAYRRKGQVGRSVRSLRRAQRLMQRRDVDDARDRLGSWSGPRTGRTLRWIVYAALAVALYLVLHSRGVL